MRLSTQAFYTGSLAAMLQQQAALAKLQNQVALGRRVNSPADDPIAAVHILELERAQAESGQFGRNADMAKNRLALEEQALADTGTLLQRVRELAVQGNTATLDDANRRTIATEVRARLKELTDIANRRDANGEYLFSGYATLTQPFTMSGGTITYAGDQGSRVLQIGADQRVGDSHSGYEAFMVVPEGNGVFVTNAVAGNTGNGVIAGGSVTDISQWVPDDYTLHFTSATGDYAILDSGANVVTTGTYTADSTIAFNGVNIRLSGMPGLDDAFTISRSRTEDMFTTLDRLVGAFESSTLTDQQRAYFNTAMASVLQQLDQTEDHLVQVRAEVGARLSSIETAQEARESTDVELARMTSELRDLDYAEAITRMNQQLLGLQAAQASYSRISQLSLFEYLR